MPKGIPKNGINKGWFKKGEHPSKKTEFQIGEHRSIDTEFKKGIIPWITGKHPIAHNKGVPCSEEQKIQIRQTVLKNYREHPEIIEKIKIARARQICPKYDTSIEIKVQEALKALGIVFTKHELLLGRYRVDIFIEPNIVIEADGDYWHNLENVKRIDKDRDYNLINNGFIVYRFWEHEINNNVYKCLEQVSITN